MNKTNDAHLAPVICVAESPEHEANWKWHPNSKNLEGIEVMTADSIRELAQYYSNFTIPYDLKPNDVLIRHPYNQGYILATDAEEEFLKASAEGIFLIARCLGATKIEYNKCNLEESIREIDSNNNIKVKVVDLGVDVKSKKIEKLRNKIEMTREFPKQEFTEERFKKAQLIAQERGLLMSSDIRSLLDARDPSLGEPMTHQTLKYELSSSLNRVMDIAFTLTVAPEFKLSSTTKIATQKRLELNVEWDISF